MSLVLKAVENAGDLQRERLVLKAEADIDIGRYAVFLCQSIDGKPASGWVPRAFWFVDMKVKAGDFVVLYSKAGKRSEKVATDGKSSSYFFYWHSGEPLMLGKYVPLVINTAGWTTLRREAPEPEQDAGPSTGTGSKT